MTKQFITEAKRMQQLAGILNENISSDEGQKTANEFGTPEYIDNESIEYSEYEDGGWYIDFTMNIPKADVPKMSIEEAQDYFEEEYNDYNYNGPGASFSKVRTSTEDGNNHWIVNIKAHGGYDI